MSALSREFKKILDLVKTGVAERTYGSERTSVFLDYLSQALPPHYTKMMKEYYQKDKKVKVQNKMDREKNLEELNKSNLELKEKVAELKLKYQFYANGDENEYEDDYISATEPYSDEYYSGDDRNSYDSEFGEEDYDDEDGVSRRTRKSKRTAKSGKSGRTAKSGEEADADNVKKLTPLEKIAQLQEEQQTLDISN